MSSFIVVAHLDRSLTMHMVAAYTNNMALADRFDLPVIELALDFLDEMREFDPHEQFYLLLAPDLDLTTALDIEAECRRSLEMVE